MKPIAIALLTSLVAVTAFAQSTSQSRCYRRLDGIYVCEAHTDTPYSTTDTICASGGTSACSSRTVPKPPPPPLDCHLPYYYQLSREDIRTCGK